MHKRVTVQLYILTEGKFPSTLHCASKNCSLDSSIHEVINDYNLESVSVIFVNCALFMELNLGLVGE